MARQLTATQLPALGRPGMCSDTNPRATDSFFVAQSETAGMEPGRLAVRDADGALAYPRGQDLDPDAVLTTTASPAAPTTYTSVEFDGVVAGAAILVPAPITVTLDSNTDWDATVAVLTYINAEGNQVSENLNIPDGGNTTLTSAEAATQVISLFIPAQTGTNGNFTIGFAASTELTSAQIAGVLMWDPTQEEVATIPAGEVAAAMRMGRIWVETDQLVSAGERAFVRITDAATPAYGVFRGDADGGEAVAVAGARFRRAASATLAELEINLPL